MLNISTHGLGATATPGTRGALKRPRDGSVLKKSGMKAAEVRSKLADMKAMISVGKTDMEIIERMQVSVIQYNELKKELYRQETASLYNQTTEETYLEYMWRQSKCITDLDEMVMKFKQTNQYNAMVGAVRAKSDILDKIIKTGQEMGVLDKAPERKLILHGIAVANMDNSNLRKMIAGELEGLAAIVNKYGDASMTGSPIIDVKALPAEMPPSPTFNEPEKPKVTGIERARAARASQVAKRKATQAKPETGFAEAEAQG